MIACAVTAAAAPITGARFLGETYPVENQTGCPLGAIQSCKFVPAGQRCSKVGPAGQRITVVSIWLTAIGLPALTGGPATWMGAALSRAVVLRAVMPTKKTAIEAATATPKILRWVLRSAAKIVELFITAAFQGLSSNRVLRALLCRVVR
jgi:hypothetical protein